MDDPAGRSRASDYMSSPLAVGEAGAAPAAAEAAVPPGPMAADAGVRTAKTRFARLKFSKRRKISPPAGPARGLAG